MTQPHDEILPDALPLLGPGDPPPVLHERPEGGSPFLLVSDHDGRAVPSALGDLGVAAADWERHIAWDIGIAGVRRHLAALLDAESVAQRYSRLVIDCNRRPGHPTWIAPVSDNTTVPANLHLDDAAREARRAAIWAPYHRAIAARLSARHAAGRRCIVVALHSFTDRMAGVARPWHAGVLHNHDPRFGRAVLDALAQEGDLVVGDNEPYRLTDDSDYTIPVHAEQQGLPHVELEIRQDLIATPDGQRAWAERLARLLPAALAAHDAAHGVSER